MSILLRSTTSASTNFAFCTSREENAAIKEDCGDSKLAKDAFSPCFIPPISGNVTPGFESFKEGLLGIGAYVFEPQYQEVENQSFEKDQILARQGREKATLI